MSDVFVDDVSQFMRSVQTSFRWQPGDLLMIDNSVTMHARNPYVGDRRILTMMSGNPSV